MKLTEKRSNTIARMVSKSGRLVLGIVNIFSKLISLILMNVIPTHLIG